MKTRWFAGALLFILGFGSAMLVRLPSANANATQGVVDGTLKYDDGPDEFRLSYPPGGKAKYLAVVTRDPDMVIIDEPLITYVAGEAAFSKEGLESVTVLKVEPLIIWNDDVFRCGNGPVLCPLPPPPGPPIVESHTFIQSRP
ncbi:MAG TPA: hypothetical protein VN493_27715 [Thermoanaerobaculia bacterium]|nr:hypothetical protein [Thermoanaerobaculia bacterium]